MLLLPAAFWQAIRLFTCLPVLPAPTVLQPLQRAAPEDVELGKPLAAQGLEAMEALRLVVRQDHVSAVQLACGVRKLLSPLQQARLALAAWPRYPDPSKWAPQLLEQLPQQGPE
jgi:hypothetical protein